MKLNWSKGLGTGVEWQDRQNQEIFHLINSLFSAIKQGEGGEDLRKIIHFLHLHATEHFGAEEDAMIIQKYRHSNGHREEHLRFMGMLLKLKRDIEDGASARYLARVQNFLMEWYYGHVSRADRQLGAFLAGDSKLPGFLFSDLRPYQKAHQL